MHYWKVTTKELLKKPCRAVGVVTAAGNHLRFKHDAIGVDKT